MEINFNTSQLSKSGYTEVLRRQETQSPPAAAADLVQTSDALQNKLSQPVVRPEAVAQAKSLIAREDYPPDDVIDRVAVLLAIKLRD